MSTRTSLISAILGSLLYTVAAAAQIQPRLTKAIDESVTVAIPGNVHPLVAASKDSDQADDATPMEHMILFLKSADAQEAQLANLIAQQNDPKSPSYHQYVSPKEFAAQYGVAQADLAIISNWLQQHGLNIEELPAGNRSIVFSGTAAQVASAFKTEIRRYTVGSTTHYANMTDPQIPAALADVVGGIVKLHDFRHGHSITAAKAVSAAELAHPQFTSGSSHYLAPADYGTIYDINPLYSASINGSGQTIAVLARSDIYMSDVVSFRSSFGLKANNPQFIITNSDPGVLQGDSVETTLDTEWSGAVAPGATIKVIISSSTNTADGIDLSALYAVNNNVAPIISLSYGSCEAAMGSSELAFYNSLWKQATAQGQTVLVSAGDSGAAGCDYGSTANYGQAVNGLCSSPYSTCVGGTEFVDNTNPGQYWQPGNNTTYGSAISYIPETVWNESGANGGSDLWAGGGGVSITYPKPSWQTGPGVPADGKRDVPDVSLTAAGHDGYLIWLYGSLNSVGGTSAAAPSFAGMMALVNQKTSGRQGLINSTLYPLAIKQASGGAAIFHDITTGNNSVPGQTGFSATTGYDRASGLGSVDATLLANHWNDAATSAPSLALTASSNSVTLPADKTAQTTITSTASSVNAAVTLSVTGAPAGMTATFTSSTIPSPGSGSVALTLTASSSIVAGTYPLTVKAVSGTQSATLTISVVVPAPTFTITPTSLSLSTLAGTSAQSTAAVTPQNGFSSPVNLSAINLPAGITASFSPATISGSNGGASVVTFNVAKSVTIGSYTFSISATGGGVTQTVPVTLAVSGPASCTLSANPTSVTVAAGQTSNVQLTCGSVQGNFTSPLNVSVAPPGGMTAKPASGTMTAGTSTTLTISPASNTAGGNYSVPVTVSGGTFTQTLAIPVTVPSPAFALSASASSLSVNTGKSAELMISTTPQYGFNSSVSLSTGGLPVGVTAAFSPASIGAGGGSSTLSLTATTTAKAGSYTIPITATGGGITRSTSVTLVISTQPLCNLVANPTSISVIAGQPGNVTVSCAVSQGSFTAPLALSTSGAPTGMTAQLASTTVPAGSPDTLNITTAISMTAGSYNVSLTASGNGYSQTVSIPVHVTAPNTFSLTGTQSALNATTGTPGQMTFTSQHFGAFNSPITFSINGLPSGVTAVLSKIGLPAPGDGTSTATFTVATSAKAGSYPLTITAIGGGVTQTLPLTLVVTTGPNFTLSLNATSVTIPQGGAGNIITSTGNYSGGFNGQLTMTFSGLVYGMNYGVVSANAANNMVNITTQFTVPASVPVGTYPITVNDVGTGVSRFATFNIIVTTATSQAKN